MIFVLSTSMVRDIYDARIAQGPLRDASALDGAVNAPSATFGGVELFPTLDAKAGKLLDSIQRAQAYQDGNKRLAWLATTTFLQLNGQLIVDTPAHEVEAFMLSLVGRADAATYAAAWLNERMRSMQ